MATKENASRWYVYELTDPRCSKVFYIGKGCGGRISAHEAEAKNGGSGSKVDRIRDIWGSGNSVIRKKVAYFWDENAAYKCEAERIAGTSGLTNIAKNKQVARKIELSFLGLVKDAIVRSGSSKAKVAAGKLRKHFHRDSLQRIDHVRLYDAAMRLSNG